ncbi:hypothetical protein ONS95_006326 [Cadophora gregata]|uniref:uncharacterized protein n=1 Tax=Cadophora gregata TaxID=51156 RepID=UPI0026DBF164|nr:uncharacterized protein ONS95_006326 [Cadophora gregata]KAK0099313.1 hypothetical protein ONS96_008542 [Cadophora gregata f. sp. sojae]KAK0102724.1 hypothetical protein ONS95_006326 [Cadophora gregata]
MIFLSITTIVWYLARFTTTTNTQQQHPLLNHEIEAVETSPWKLNFSSEAPHYFASVYGLLQQWPNTFFPNGHSIVPCEVPAFTKLYHGRMDAELPPSPEWFAFDIGMSYGIMGGSQNSHMLTYQTTRRIRCIYLDGESATLSGTGQLDTQMLHIWGNISGPGKQDGGFNPLSSEYARAVGLCNWIRDTELGGLGWGYEGIVRMNAGFEMIWCNFSSPSVRLVSHLNVSAPLLPPRERTKITEELESRDLEEKSKFPLPTRTTPAKSTSSPPPFYFDWDLKMRDPFRLTRNWGWYTSSTLHYGSSGNGPGIGESRVKPDICGFLSYYNPTFERQGIARRLKEQKVLNLTAEGFWAGPRRGKRSTALEALTRRRRQHVLDNVTSSEAALLRTNSERVMRDRLLGIESCSGVDWLVLTNSIVQTYSRPLLKLSKTLENYGNHTSNSSLLQEWMSDVHQQTHMFVMPFFEYPEDADEETWKPGSELFEKTYSLCRFQHTRLLDPEEGIVLGPEETLLKWAVEETTGGICSVIIEIGLAVKGLWQAKFNRAPISDTEARLAKSIKSEVHRWTNGIQELMAWLGWAGEWIGCEEKCAWDESCFIPMWPLLKGRDRSLRRPPPGNGTRYGYPGGRYPPPPYYSPPGNRTGRPGKGSSRWMPTEEDLWEPKCVKSNYLYS